MPAIDSVDNTRSAQEPLSTIPDISKSAQPLACSTTAIWARRAGAFTWPITSGSATAIVTMLTVMATRSDAMSMCMGGRVAADWCRRALLDCPSRIARPALASLFVSRISVVPSNASRLQQRHLTASHVERDVVGLGKRPLECDLHAVRKDALDTPQRQCGKATQQSRR